MLTGAPGNSAGVFLSPISGRTEWSRCSTKSSGVLTLNNRLILGSLIALGIAFTVQAATVPAVDMSLGAKVPTVEASETAGTTVAFAVSEEPTTQAEVEAYVKDYFSDIPVLVEVARCESHFRQTDATTGETLRGVVNTNDVGVMQVNTHYHETTAKRLGHDLYELKGNLAYARYLYEREGTRPWSASRACWEPGHLAMR